jgi:hypothetical protein
MAPQVLVTPRSPAHTDLEVMVDTIRIAQPAPSTTCVTRGLALAQEYFEEITRVSPWIWSVPSATGAGIYACNLKTGECSCEDRTPAGEADKHVVAAKYKKAKTATCSGCSERLRHRDLVEVVESLTYFEGDLLCPECWH